MSETKVKTQKRDNKKIILIILIVVASLALMASVYAVISEVYEINHKVTTGTVTLQDINLKIEDRLTGTMEEKLTRWSPGDASLLTWDTVNTGTAAVRTRHTIQLYWDNSNIGESAKDLLYFYPANMTNEEVLADFNSGKQKAIEIDRESAIEVDEEQKVGVSYTFYGDNLDGTERTGFATEVNYDDQDFGTETFTTVETNNLSDKIAIRLLLNPDTSYLFQEEELSIKVITEALQYTEDGTEEWTIQSSQTID